MSFARSVPIGLLLCSLVACGIPGGSDNPPNIVIILADDMGLGDISFFNSNSKIPTPHLDRLATQGMNFSDAHSPSSVCTPTRYGLLTGRYCWRTHLEKGVLDGESPSLIEPDRRTIASVLKERGYQTAAIGKWHLGLGNKAPTDYRSPLIPSPNSYGFDYFFGIPASLDMPPYLYVENDRAVEQATEYVEAGAHRREGGGGFWRGGLAAANFRHMEVLPRITEKAVAYIEAQADRQMTPFFLYLALTAPHTPWLPLERFRNRSKAGYYGDFCVQVDDTVGAIVQALNRSGLSDRTLLIFTSDNGAHWPQPDIARYGHRANLHFRGQKADIWEGGHRIPLILRWPGKIAEGSHSSRLVSLTDLYATFAALVGTALEDNEAEDSFNILPNLTGGSGDSPIRDAMVQHSKDGMFAIRKGDWKLIQGLGSGGFTQPAKIEPGPGEMEGQLYNMAEDPAEQHNLYQSEPKRVEDLSALLKAYQESGRTRGSAYPSP